MCASRSGEGIPTSMAETHISSPAKAGSGENPDPERVAYSIAEVGASEIGTSEGAASGASGQGEEVYSDILALIPQLSSSPPAFTREHLDEIVSSPASRLLVARDEDGRVHGMLTLAIFRAPTGVRAWIEDVVVNETLRGGGLGAALVAAALDTARAAGARTVDLTSRPSREAANRLYLRLGFEQRDTNIYRYQL